MIASTARRWSEETEASFRRLARLLRLDRTHALHFVSVVPFHRLRECAEEVKRLLEGEVQVVDITLDGAQLSPIHALVEQAPEVCLATPEHPEMAPGDQWALFVYGLDASLEEGNPEQQAALHNFNAQRDRLRRLRAPTVFWVREDTLDRLASQLPDLWSWVTGTFRIQAGEPVGPPDWQFPLPFSVLSVENLDGAAKSQRTKRYENLMASLENRDLTGSGESALLARDVAYDLAQLYEGKAEYEQSFACYERALALARQFHDAASTRGILVRMGRLLTRSGQDARAEQCCKEALSLAPDGPEDGFRQIALLSLAYTLFRQGRNEEATEVLQQLNGLRPEFLSEEDQVWAIALLARIRLLDEDPATASLWKGVRQQVDPPALRSSTALLEGEADYAFQHEQYDEARSLYRDARAGYLRLRDRRGAARTLAGEAAVAALLGEYDRAARLYDEAAEEFQRLDAKEEEAMIKRRRAAVSGMLAAPAGG